MTPETLEELAARCVNGAGLDNALDVEIEVALFEPEEDWIAIRPNDAGTKVIVTDAGGKDHTYWAEDWTRERNKTAAIIRAHACNLGEAKSL